MKILAFSSNKGGVGKSTLALLTGNAGASAGFRVLICDIDYQSNSTQYHIPNMEGIEEKNIYKVLTQGNVLENIIPSYIDGIDIIPATYEAHSLFRSISPQTVVNLFSQEELAARYDLLIFDCPPSLNNLVLGAWMTADTIVTPARIDKWDITGLNTLREAIKEALGDKIGNWKIVLNFMSRRKTSLDETFREWHPEIIPVEIPNTVIIHRAMHDNFVITRTKKAERVFDRIIDLTSNLMGKEIVLRRIEYNGTTKSRCQ